MQPNPSLKLTHYGRRRKTGVGRSIIFTHRACSACLYRQLSSNVRRRNGLNLDTTKRTCCVLW